MNFFRLIFHNVFTWYQEHFPKILGISMSTVSGVILTASIIEVINGVLQTVLLICTIAGSIISTWVVLKNKKKKGG